MRNFITATDRVLHVHHPRVLVETAVAMGANRDALFANSGLSADMLTSPEMRVSYLQYATLATAALELTGAPDLGLHVGRNIGIAQMGVLGLLLPNSPTLGAAIEGIMRYGSALTPLWEYALEIRGTSAFLSFKETLPLAHLRVFAYETMFASFDTHTRQLSGNRPLPVRRVELPFPQPAHASKYREVFYDVPMDFERQVARVEFDRDLLSVPIAFADPATFKIAEQFCAQLLGGEPGRDGLLAQVRRLLAKEPSSPPTLAEVARTLRTSTRTLRRELHKMKTSYSELLDDARHARAEEWMARDGEDAMPIDRLARNLGFSTVGSFRRAYKRWQSQGRSAIIARGT